MYKIDIDGIQFHYKNIEKKRQTFQDCDKQGQKVGRVYTQKAEYHYETEDGKTIQKAEVFKLVGEKPMVKLNKTKEIKEMTYVPKVKAMDLMNDKYYQLTYKGKQGDELKERLATKDEALHFMYSNAGFKPYQAYIIEVQGELIMIAGYGYLSEQIEHNLEVPVEIKKEKAVPEGVETATASALM